MTITDLLTVVSSMYGWPTWERAYEIMIACGRRDPAWVSRPGYDKHEHYNPASGSPEWCTTVSEIIDAIAGERQVTPQERDALLAAILAGDDTPGLRDLLRDIKAGPVNITELLHLVHSMFDVEINLADRAFNMQPIRDSDRWAMSIAAIAHGIAEPRRATREEVDALLAAALVGDTPWLRDLLLDIKAAPLLAAENKRAESGRGDGS